MSKSAWAATSRSSRGLTDVMRTTSQSLPALRQLHRLRPLPTGMQRDGLSRHCASADTTAGRLAYYDFTRPANLCIGCGACAQVCPTGAIHVDDDVDGMRRTVITGTVVRVQAMLTCSSCGALTQTLAHREFVRARLKAPAHAHMLTHLERELCADCARQLADRPWQSCQARHSQRRPREIGQ